MEDNAAFKPAAQVPALAPTSQLATPSSLPVPKQKEEKQKDEKVKGKKIRGLFEDGEPNKK